MQKYDVILLSIIIIVKNEEKRISQCLESLLLNFDKKCMELILVDGNSNDKTVNIIKEFIHKYNFIKLIECKECGYSYQRNMGINNAQGKYVLYISGDTVVSKGMLSKYMQIMRKDTYDIIYFLFLILIFHILYPFFFYFLLLHYILYFIKMLQRTLHKSFQLLMYV